jgi:hypothetical protein
VPLGRRACCAALLAVLPLTGCGLTHLQDLNFRVDKRLHFLTPKDRSTVARQFTVSWTMKDFTIAAPGSAPASRDAGYFAVFVDRTPIKPGQTMKALAHGDLSCERDPKCPDVARLAEMGVYPTTRTSLRITQVTNVLGDKERLQHHSVTVVLMDTAGHRIGESAWEVDVRIPRAGSA